MYVGDKIRAIRILRDMTQKELGQRVGFSAATADVRIRQYESNKMVPKEDKLNEIANALNVDPSALKAHGILNDLDVIQVLFELEERFGLTLNKENESYIFSFDREHPTAHRITCDLDCWHRAKTKIPDETSDTNYTSSMHNYKLWKSRFPLDKKELEAFNEEKVANKYASLVAETLDNGFTIETVKDFILIFEKLIRNGIEIALIQAPEHSSVGVHVIAAIFQHKQLLGATGDAEKAYVEYLCAIQRIQEMGIEIVLANDTYEGETFSYTYFFNSLLSTAFEDVVNKMIDAHKEGAMDDLLVKMKYEEGLKIFDTEISNN